MLATGYCPAAKAVDANIQAAETNVRLGMLIGYNDYQKNVSSHENEMGTLGGLTAGMKALSPGLLAGYRLPDLYSDVTDDFLTGFLRYKCQFPSQNDVSYATRDDAYYNTVIVRLGAGTPLAGDREIIPYMAGGYQSWHRNFGGNSGFGEFYQAELIGGGLRLDYASMPGLVLSAAAEGFAVIGGAVTGLSQNSDASFGTSAAERVSLGADYRLTSAWHAFAGLGLAHYGNTSSRPDGLDVYEPFGTILQVDSTFGFAYGF